MQSVGVHQAPSGKFVGHLLQDNHVYYLGPYESRQDAEVAFAAKSKHLQVSLDSTETFSFMFIERRKPRAQRKSLCTQNQLTRFILERTGQLQRQRCSLDRPSQLLDG